MPPDTLPVFVPVIGAAVLLVGIAILSGWATDRRGEWLRRLRDDLSEGAQILLGLLAVAWMALFLMVGIAAFHSAQGMLLPAQGDSGGLGSGLVLAS